MSNVLYNSIYMKSLSIWRHWLTVLQEDARSETAWPFLEALKLIYIAWLLWQQLCSLNLLQKFWVSLFLFRFKHSAMTSHVSLVADWRGDSLLSLAHLILFVLRAFCVPVINAKTKFLCDQVFIVLIHKAFT